MFVTRYPASQAALAVVDADADGSRWARRFEVYAGGLELANEKLDRFHGLLTGDRGGSVSAVDHWGQRQLAYPINDQTSGYYTVAHFTAPAEALPEFERLLKLDDELMRYLVVVNEGNLQTTPVPPQPKKDESEEESEEE